MQTGTPPVFLWIDSQMVNMSLCQGVCYYFDEEDGWVVSFNMLDEFIFVRQENEEDAKQALIAVFSVLNARGYVVGMQQTTPSEPPAPTEPAKESLV